jgi:hypothetical protein
MNLVREFVNSPLLLLQEFALRFLTCSTTLNLRVTSYVTKFDIYFIFAPDSTFKVFDWVTKIYNVLLL